MLAKALRSHGYDARRGVQYAGGTESPDVVGLPGVHIECKWVQNLNIHKAYEQAVRDAGGKAIPAVFHKRNGEPFMVTLSLNDFMEIYQIWEKIHSSTT